jgi:hypothetical protein
MALSLLEGRQHAVDEPPPSRSDAESPTTSFATSSRKGATMLLASTRWRSVKRDSPGDPMRDPTARARLASGLVAGTPSTVRAFLATLRHARSEHTVSPAFARAEQAEGRRPPAPSRDEQASPAAEAYPSGAAPSSAEGHSRPGAGGGVIAPLHGVGPCSLSALTQRRHGDGFRDRACLPLLTLERPLDRSCYRSATSGR